MRFIFVVSMLRDKTIYNLSGRWSLIVFVDKFDFFGVLMFVCD